MTRRPVSLLILVFPVLTFLFSSCGGGSSSSSSSPSPGAVPLATTHALVAWNDLGMHCMDNDYSVFGILPPYNNLHAQLVDRTTGRQVTSGVTITYEAVADTRGSINTTSVGKSNFWAYVLDLFGITLPPNTGLAGKTAPGVAPAALAYDNAAGFWRAEGIPIIPKDDAGNLNFYPMVKLVARSSGGTVLATTKTVLPVSTEMTCRGCHSSNVGGAVDALPAGGWVFDNNAEKDWKLNILRIHDDRNFGTPANVAAYTAALSANLYNATGLENTVRLDRKSVLCAKCHASNALGTTGAAGVKALTAAIHAHHAAVIQHSTGLPLDNGADRTACFVCHPGSVTQCLRGVMGNAKDANGNLMIQCQSCHGNMSAVGAASRRGWLDLPDCRHCHYVSPTTGNYVRDNTVFGPGGAYRQVAGLFASPGLYKVSAGHGSVQCEACHGSTHAEYACSEANDNVQTILLQGYPGKIVECAVCHIVTPLTPNGGPHGIHTIGQAWVSGHGNYAQANLANCATCHGPDYRGTFLSTVSRARGLGLGDRGSTTFARGHKAGCYDCHNGTGGW